MTSLDAIFFKGNKSSSQSLAFFATENIKKITSLHFALEKNFELYLWASLERKLQNIPRDYATRQSRSTLQCNKYFQAVTKAP